MDHEEKILSILVAAILFLNVFAVNASAENATVVGQWNIVLDDDIGANFYLSIPAASNAAVKVTVTPNEGYSQKLYINGKPLLLDWKTNTYCFVADEEIYHITGSFAPSLNAAATIGYHAANSCNLA